MVNKLEFKQLINKNIKLSVIILIFLLVFSPFTSSFNGKIKAHQINNFSENTCFGFIIPLPSGNDTTYETFLNSRVRNLVNDLLRENVSVYWSSENFTAYCKNINIDEGLIEKNFKKGDFLIPFSGNNFIDTLTTSIILDYGFISEIEPDELETQSYLLLQNLNFSGYKLIEPKIVQHLGKPTRYAWPAYIQIAEAGGFFSMDFLLDNETADKLNNEDYNVFMWPYNPSRSKTYEVLATLFDKKQCNAVRNFVKNGGGFIGSCYGAEVASSGMVWPLFLINILPSYNPNLPCFGIFYSMSDSITNRRLLPNIRMMILTTTIEDTNHPISYGMNTTFKDFFDGAWFPWTGKNTHTIATMTELESVDNIEKYPNTIIGSPSWMNTTFGDGKLLLFPSHPEFVNNLPVVFDRYEWDSDKFYGRRLLHNSLYFVTSEEVKEINYSINQPVTFIQEISDKTTNLSIESISNQELELIINRIYNLNKNLTQLNETSIQIRSIFSDLINTTIVFQSKHNYLFSYTHYICEIFKNYNQKAIYYLDLISKIYPLIYEYNDLVQSTFNSFKSDILLYLNQSEDLVKNVNDIADNILDLIKNKRSLIKNILIVKNSRKMLNDFEIGLKYLPKLYFESCKLSRSFWYNYETNVALD